MINNTQTTKTRDQIVFQEFKADTALSDSTALDFDGESTINVEMGVSNQSNTPAIFPNTGKRFTKLIGVVVKSILRLFHWLNGSGSTRIDEKRMKTRCDQQLGLRKWNL